MELYIKPLRNTAIIPEYAHRTDAGLDLFFCPTDEADTVIAAGARGVFATGIGIALEEGYVGLVWDKSGIAVKNGLKVMAGVIDAGYRGEVSVVLHNLSAEDVVIKNGQKIAQLLVQPIVRPTLQIVDTLPDSWDERDAAGFGSTGLQSAADIKSESGSTSV